MKPTSKTTVTISPPSRAAWDFDLGGCPLEELEHCCFYEYSLGSESVKRLVATWRRNRKRLNKPDDELGNSIRDCWYGSRFRVLADHPEFPRKHWLEIDPHRRRQKVKRLSPYSRMDIPGKPPKYFGPQRSHSTRLAGEMAIWTAIVEDISQLRDQFAQARRTPESLCNWPTQLKGYLSTKELSHWKAKLSNLSGTNLYNAANKLRLACGKRIEKLRRNTHELVVYEIDWTLRPDELKETFSQWAEANRVHDPRRRSGGHETKAVERLKALGAKRLLDFFREHQGKLPLPYRAQTLHAGLHDFTIDQRKAAGRPAEPLYRTRKGWNDAEALAIRHLQKNFS